MEKKNLVKKGLAISVIILFIVSSFGAVGQNEKLISDNKPTESIFIEIPNIEGGFGVHAVIHSGYHSDLYDVGWGISLYKGSGLILIGKERTGVIKTFPAGERIEIWSFVFGIFGRGTGSYIKVSVIWEGSVVEQRIAIGEIVGPFVRKVVVDPHMV